MPPGYVRGEPLRIGNQIQLLVDDYAVEDRWKVTRETGAVLKHLRNPVSNGVTVVLEIKGFEDDQTKAKHTAANRWVEAVHNWGQLRRWAFHVCRNPQLLDKEMEYLARAESARSGMDRTFQGEL